MPCSDVDNVYNISRNIPKISTKSIKDTIPSHDPTVTGPLIEREGKVGLMGDSNTNTPSEAAILPGEQIQCHF